MSTVSRHRNAIASQKLLDHQAVLEARREREIALANNPIYTAAVAYRAASDAAWAFDEKIAAMEIEPTRKTLDHARAQAKKADMAWEELIMTIEAAEDARAAYEID